MGDVAQTGSSGDGTRLDAASLERGKPCIYEVQYGYLYRAPNPRRLDTGLAIYISGVSFQVRQVRVPGEMMALIRDLWRGDLPLVKTYWLFGVVGGIFFNIAFTYIEYQSAV